MVTSPIETVSHDTQSRWREVHFGDRARTAKIGPSEEGDGGGGCRKQSPKDRRFLPPFTGSKTYAVKAARRTGSGCSGKPAETFAVSQRVSNDVSHATGPAKSNLIYVED